MPAEPAQRPRRSSTAAPPEEDSGHAASDAPYLRFTGPMTVTVYRAGEQVEEYADDAIWELMYFGHARMA